MCAHTSISIRIVILLFFGTRDQGGNERVRGGVRWRGGGGHSHLYPYTSQATVARQRWRDGHPRERWERYKELSVSVSVSVTSTCDLQGTGGCIRRSAWRVAVVAEAKTNRVHSQGTASKHTSIFLIHCLRACLSRYHIRGAL